MHRTDGQKVLGAIQKTVDPPPEVYDIEYMFVFQRVVVYSMIVRILYVTLFLILKGKLCEPFSKCIHEFTDCKLMLEKV